jgi:hypothetical protein
MARIPEQITSSVRVLTGATPSITLAAPTSDVSWVIDSVHTRMVNAGAGNYAVVLRISDTGFGLIFSWEIVTNAPAGAVDVDDPDLQDLGIVCARGASVTIDWNGPAPAGGNSGGMISAVAHLAG